MGVPEVHIQSYFSIETDLAQSFHYWPEFVEGEGYQVELKSDKGEAVSIELVTDKDKNECPFVLVKSNRDSELFQRALGLATYLLALHSDHLMVQRWS